MIASDKGKVCILGSYIDAVADIACVMHHLAEEADTAMEDILWDLSTAVYFAEKGMPEGEEERLDGLQEGRDGKEVGDVMPGRIRGRNSRFRREG